MSPLAWLLAQLLTVVAGVVVTWFLARRFLPARWSAIAWGMLTFPLSQVARYALIIPLFAVLMPVLGERFALVSVIIMVLTSGLFEETARWVVLRYWAKGTRSWPDGVGFGVGHGGIEAILLIGLSALSGIATLTLVDPQALTSVGVSAAEVGQVQAQIDALQALSGWLVGLSIYERVLAIIFHVTMSLLVLRSVMTRRWQLWALAVVLHCGFNSIAVALAPADPSTATPAGLAPLYAVLTVVSLLALWTTWRGPLSRATFPAGDRPRAQEANNLRQGTTP